MVDSKEKGARAEIAVRDELRKLTGLGWERTPSSGALDPIHLLKGDLYVPGHNNKYVVEVKHYADDNLTSSILTAKSPIMLMWWEQAIRQANSCNKKALLIFKYDRSKLFVAFSKPPDGLYNYILLNINDYMIYVALLHDWYEEENIKFI